MAEYNVFLEMVSADEMVVELTESLQMCARFPFRSIDEDGDGLRSIEKCVRFHRYVACGRRTQDSQPSSPAFRPSGAFTSRRVVLARLSHSRLVEGALVRAKPSWATLSSDRDARDEKHKMRLNAAPVVLDGVYCAFCCGAVRVVRVS